MKNRFPVLCMLLAFFTGSMAFGQKLKLPRGFMATSIAEDLGAPRHIAVNGKGGIYVKLARLKEGKGIVYLKAMPDGKYLPRLSFGDYPGTGICIKGSYLYASSNDAVYRYALDKNGEAVNPEKPETIVTGLVDHKLDNSKSLAVDNHDNLYVSVGSYANACLLDPKSKIAPNPCPILDSVGGVWQFKTNKLNQQYKDGLRYATGFKHIVGLYWNSQTNSLFVMQHGRGDLNNLYPDLFTMEQDRVLPAETMYELRKGADGGWPYEYYDQFQHKKIMSPEYGGDGKKAGTHKALDPLLALPAHLGPNGLLFYTGKTFPARYRNGAFITFHGKSPELQKGYMVAFVPFANGRPSGKWEIFADHFLINKDQHKPCGLAQGADGAVYVTDDSNGSVYKIQYGK